MKRILAVILTMLILTGCSLTESEMDKALELRNRLLSQGYSFDVTITADNMDKVYTFGMHCEVQTDGVIDFCVTSPETVSGITGKVSDSGGEFTMDQTVLAFETVADGNITPVTSPWVVFQGLRSGYIRACGKGEDGIHIQLYDSYEEDALYMDVWTDKDNLPKTAQIYWDGKRIMSLEMENFCFL